MGMFTLIPGFYCLGPSIYISKPWLVNADGDQSKESSSTDSSPSQAPPDLIIITPWTGAAPKHIIKYTEMYETLYPTTPILVITTEIQDLVLRSRHQKVCNIDPAVQFLHRPRPERVRPDPVFKNILLHAFSEGGANKATILAYAFLATTSHRLAVSAFILDSTPGKPHFGMNLAALRRSLPQNKAVRFFCVPAGAALLGLHYAFYAVVGPDKNVISKTRRELNNTNLWRVRNVPRTYIFSRSDDLVLWEDIEAHGQFSHDKFGVPSEMVRFTGTSHCRHARGNEDRYWKTVCKTWEKAGSTKC